MILEVIVSSWSANDPSVHLAPMGVHVSDEGLLILPFKPSRTLDNLLETRSAVINFTDDVRVFAGCITGRRDWPLVEGSRPGFWRLESALAHQEVLVVGHADHELRPRLECAVAFEQSHAPFRGFNRAQFAVIELAILASRLAMLPAEKVRSEMDYLAIGFHKTAGPRETEAWGWLEDKITGFLDASS